MKVRLVKFKLWFMVRLSGSKAKISIAAYSLSFLLVFFTSRFERKEFKFVTDFLHHFYALVSLLVSLLFILCTFCFFVSISLFDLLLFRCDKAPL